MGTVDLLQVNEGVVFSYSYCNGLGTLVMEEVGCQTGKKGTEARRSHCEPSHHPGH